MNNINRLDFPLCEDVIDRINKLFCIDGWITLYEERVSTVLISNSIIAGVLASPNWELRPFDHRPCMDAAGYQRLYNPDVEPLVYFQEAKAGHQENLRLTDELIMFYDLRERRSGRDVDYVLIDECGSDKPVARVKDGRVEIRLNYLKEFAAIKDMSVLVQYDFHGYNLKTLEELKLEPKAYADYSFPDVLFGYALTPSGALIAEHKSFATIQGKVLIRCTPKDIQNLWDEHDTRFEEFIVGSDADGNEIYCTCEESRLPNLFTRKGDEPFALTPSFFRREVLRKYFDDTARFEVRDGAVSGTEWMIRADTDRSDGLVAVTLVDLGRLPYNEQVHWKQYNVLPEPGTDLSHTTRERWYNGNACNASESLDFVFKEAYVKLNREWERRYGWPLFKPLAKEDEFRWDSLHEMTTRNNDTEFHAMAQHLVIIAVDSLNEAELARNIDDEKEEVKEYLKEKKVAKAADLKGGISKLEVFLISESRKDDDVIKMLRNLQSLRSSTVAHRKSSSPKPEVKKLMEWCGLDTGTQREALHFIFAELIDKLSRLQPHEEA